MSQRKYVHLTRRRNDFIAGPGHQWSAPSGMPKGGCLRCENPINFRLQDQIESRFIANYARIFLLRMKVTVTLVRYQPGLLYCQHESCFKAFRSQVKGSNRWRRGAISGGGERSQVTVESSGLRERGAISGGD